MPLNLNRNKQVRTALPSDREKGGTVPHPFPRGRLLSFLFSERSNLSRVLRFGLNGSFIWRGAERKPSPDPDLERRAEPPVVVAQPPLVAT